MPKKEIDEYELAEIVDSVLDIERNGSYGIKEREILIRKTVELYGFDSEIFWRTYLLRKL